MVKVPEYRLSFALTFTSSRMFTFPFKSPVEPMKMELFVADADGRNARQITNFNCASFAPTFTPDGKQILFSSNRHGCDGRKFELYLINADGTNLRQVTNFGSFTLR